MSSGRTLPSDAEPAMTPQPAVPPTNEFAPIDLPQSQRWCRRLATSHYENFLVASILLPRSLRQPFYNIYAFCRTADDFADESDSRDRAVEQLSQLQRDIDALFAGRAPSHSFFPALADTVRSFGLEKRPFDDLISAFCQDQDVSRYAEMGPILDYCSRSANPVGRLLLQLADCSNPTTRELSDQICTGLQLANFWQDVARDYQIGRIYLPEDRCQAFGVRESMLDKSMLGESETAAPLRELLAELCDETEAYFRRGLPLADHVPSWFAADVKLFAHGGLATLDAIRKSKFDVIRRRPKVGKMKQLSLVARAMLGRL